MYFKHRIVTYRQQKLDTVLQCEWLKASGSAVLEILNCNTAFKSPRSVVNMLFSKCLIIWNLLDVTSLCCLSHKMCRFATSNKHAKLYLEEVLMGSPQSKVSVKKWNFDF